MREDFGDWGDEAFLNLCAEDWRDMAPQAEAPDSQLDAQFEDRFQRDELDLEFDRDLFDIVREHDEQEDWNQMNEEGDRSARDYGDMDCVEEDEDYLNCDWEE